MKRLLSVAVLALAVFTVGRAQLALNAIGGTVGFVSVSPTASSESFSGFAISAHADLGEVAKDITLVPDVVYWSASKSVNGVSLSVGNFGIDVNGHYNIAMEGMLKPYVGAGLGLDFFSITLPGFSFLGGSVGTQSYSYTRLGINLLAGANYKLNDKMTLVVEPRYVLASDFNHFAIKAGVTYSLK